jgi:hypothetical protein
VSARSLRRCNERRAPRVGAYAAAVIAGLAGLSCLALPSAKALATTAPRPASAARPHCPSAQFGAAVDISGGTAVIGAQGASNGGAVCIFAQKGKTWSLQASLSDPTRGKYDEFGTVVAVSTTASGTYLMVGALGDQTQTLRDPLGRHDGNWFGATLAMSGSYAVITAIGTRNFQGAVYAYALSGRTWHLAGTLKNPGTSYFGGLASMSGSTIMIGNGSQSSPPGNPAVESRRASPLRSAGSGPYQNAYVYVKSGSTWHLQAYLGVKSNDNSEPSVAISGSIAVIAENYVQGFGGPTSSNEWGRIYVYSRTGHAWRNIQVLTDPTVPDGSFSNSLSMSSGTMVAGAPYDNCGVAYVYKWTGKKWALRVKMLPPGGSKCEDAFGWSVAVSGQSAIVGAPGNGKTYVLNIP